MFSIVLTVLGISSVAATNRGDMDSNGVINAIDMIFIKRYLIESEVSYSYLVDVNEDNCSDIRDFIRIKKYLGGMYKERFNFEINEGFVWTILQGDAMGVVVLVGYRVESKSWIETDRLSSRYAYEAETFAYAVKNPNPEINLPEISVGETTLNGYALNMLPLQSLEPPYTYIDPDWIWALEGAYFNIETPENSTYNSLVTIMMPGSIYPLREINNTIIF